MSSRARLDSTVIASIDVADQPAAPYVFVIEGLLGPRQAFAIDGWRVEKGQIVGVRHEEHPAHSGIYRDAAVIAVPVNAPWAIVRRDTLIFTTVTESAKKRKVDDLAQANFEKELYPSSNPPATADDNNPRLTPPVLGHYL